LFYPGTGLVQDCFSRVVDLGNREGGGPGKPQGGIPGDWKVVPRIPLGRETLVFWFLVPPRGGPCGGPITAVGGIGPPGGAEKLPSKWATSFRANFPQRIWAATGGKHTRGGGAQTPTGVFSPPEGGTLLCGGRTTPVWGRRGGG